MQSDTTPIAGMSRKAFTSLARLYVYHFIDLRFTTVNTARKRKRLLANLHREGMLLNCYDPETCGGEVTELYHRAIERYAADKLPVGWAPSVDHWGARCIEYYGKWTAPKSGTLFCGDIQGLYMAFTCADALDQYTAEKLQEIESKPYYAKQLQPR